MASVSAGHDVRVAAATGPGVDHDRIRGNISRAAVARVWSSGIGFARSVQTARRILVCVRGAAGVTSPAGSRLRTVRVDCESSLGSSLSGVMPFEKPAAWMHVWCECQCSGSSSSAARIGNGICTRRGPLDRSHAGLGPNKMARINYDIRASIDESRTCGTDARHVFLSQVLADVAYKTLHLKTIPGLAARGLESSRLQRNGRLELSTNVRTTACKARNAAGVLRLTFRDVSDTSSLHSSGTSGNLDIGLLTVNGVGHEALRSSTGFGEARELHTGLHSIHLAIDMIRVSAGVIGTRITTSVPHGFWPHLRMLSWRHGRVGPIAGCSLLVFRCREHAQHRRTFARSCIATRTVFGSTFQSGLLQDQEIMCDRESRLEGSIRSSSRQHLAVRSF
ncbi:hypothetical protein C8Q74DRAFT_1217058 [Fomes fomentarius]|nr:hypothetical protein C8Q74DRAFT_1217058 [Fomes fomentarius]